MSSTFVYLVVLRITDSNLKSTLTLYHSPNQIYEIAARTLSYFTYS